MREEFEEKEEKVNLEIESISTDNLEIRESDTDLHSIQVLSKEEIIEVDSSKSEDSDILYNGIVEEVPSKKFIIDDKVITITFRRDINAIAGREIDDDELKRRFITAIKMNGEEMIQVLPPLIDYDPEIVTPPMIGTKQRTGGSSIIDYDLGEVDPIAIDDDPLEEKKISKFKPKYLIPILIPIFLFLMAHSCAKNDSVPVIEYDRIPIDVIAYNNHINPDIRLHNIEAERGQEEATKDGIEGIGLFDENGAYSWREQLEKESKTASDSIVFQQMKQQIEYHMGIFVDESSTQEQKYIAAKELLNIYQQIEGKYKENLPMIEESGERFEEASRAYEDENTDIEIELMDNMDEEYMMELKLAESNVKLFEELVKLMEAGYELSVQCIVELDNDRQFKGEAVKETVKDLDPAEVKSGWEKFADWFRGKSDRGIENDGR